MSVTERGSSPADVVTGEQVPLVNYLALTDAPHLVATVCTACGASYFGRRNGCAACGGAQFTTRAVAREGVLTSFSIVHLAAPGVDVPFISGTIDCDGVLVKANVVGVPCQPEAVHVGMRLQLTTWPLAPDVDGRVAIAFGFTPTEGNDV
ncbi:MAG: OB-fold domain-containing protein [Ilumatobacteraceae bacterium]